MIFLATWASPARQPPASGCRFNERRAIPIGGFHWRRPGYSFGLDDDDNNNNTDNVDGDDDRAA